jgi:ABC-type uncharacterized transport system substrate-binding protein
MRCWYPGARGSYLTPIVAVVLATTLSAVPASAEITQNDMLGAGRAIGFINNLPRGEVRVGIVYDPGVTQSSQQAAELGALMRNGLRIGGLTLVPVMVTIGNFEGNGVALYFLTEGVGAAAGKVGRASRERKISCVTFDLNQVRSGACVIGVQSRPRIEVIVNRAAAQASGTILSAVFRMMITEI